MKYTIHKEWIVNCDKEHTSESNVVFVKFTGGNLKNKYRSKLKLKISWLVFNSHSKYYFISSLIGIYRLLLLSFFMVFLSNVLSNLSVRRIIQFPEKNHVGCLFMLCEPFWSLPFKICLGATP